MNRVESLGEPSGVRLLGIGAVRAIYFEWMYSADTDSVRHVEIHNRIV